MIKILCGIILFGLMTFISPVNATVISIKSSALSNIVYNGNLPPDHPSVIHIGCQSHDKACKAGEKTKSAVNKGKNAVKKGWEKTKSAGKKAKNAAGRFANGYKNKK